MCEKTLLMIKPEGTDYIEDIVSEIRCSGLKISEGYDWICAEGFLKSLYKDQSGGFWEVNKEYLVGKRCVLFVVSGEQAAERLFSLAGTHYSPEKCERDSIRYRFGKRELYIGKNGRELYLNAVHRSSPENAEYEVELFHKWFKI